MKRILTSTITILSLGLSVLNACEQGTAESETKSAEVADSPVSETAQRIEQAQRLLDRGGDPTAAKGLLLQSLAESDLTRDEQADAILALSLAHESLGNDEEAIAVLERLMSERRNDTDWSRRDYKKRLRALLTGTDEVPGVPTSTVSQAPAFAQLLVDYFPADADGRVTSRFMLFGGDSKISNALQTFDVEAGLRARKERNCPLCEHNVSVSNSRSRGDWLRIPVVQGDFGDAMVVFYFDLGKNRIAKRYESYLPMPVDRIVAELEQGKSFVFAKDRVGAPPVLLIAAPRSGMLSDVERRLGALDALPLEPQYFDISPQLRPEEIKGTLRKNAFPKIRECYQALLKREPKAEGKLVLELAIEKGAVAKIGLETEQAALQGETFSTCMREAASEIAFPAQAANRLSIRYPVVFRADD